VTGTRAVSALVLALAGFLAEASQAPQPTLHLGVVSFYNPRLMFIKHQPMVDYLTATTGRPWDLVVVPSYERLVDDLCSRKMTRPLISAPSPTLEPALPARRFPSRRSRPRESRPTGASSWSGTIVR
jgi:hypothetical protein